MRSTYTMMNPDTTNHSRSSVATLAATTAMVLAAMMLPFGRGLLAQQNTDAQTMSDQVGIYMLYQLVQHDADFGGLPNIPCCSPAFSDGTGPGVAAGGLYQLALGDRFGLQLRAGYSLFTGTMTTDENIGNALDASNTVVDAMSRHTLESTLSQLTLEPMLVLQPLSIPLRVNLGLRAGLTIASSYDLREELLSPDNVTFSDGSTARNVSSGAIPDESGYDIGVTGGLSYDIPVGDRFIIAPEVSYDYNFTDVIADSNWKAHALRLGVALKMGMEPNRMEVPEAPLVASIKAMGLYPPNSEQQVVRMKVEEFYSPQLRPLLNYIFFAPGSATLPDRYHRITPDQTDAFRIDRLYQLDGVETYHHVLNIVGKRLRDNPDATIRLVGCTSERPGDAGVDGLARSRAQSVHDYLQNVWGIPDSRMTIETRGLPQKPSNPDVPDGIEENQRVEIYSDNNRIFEPVLTDDTLRTVTPPAIRFHPTARPEENVASWRIVASQDGQPLKSFSGTGAVPPTVDWDLQNDQPHVPRAETPMEYALTATDGSGRQVVTPLASIPVQLITLRHKRIERIRDKQIDRYSLILFDFGKSDIGPQNQRIIDMIRNRITIDAYIAIDGHTDRVGDAALNKQLSIDRANAVAKAIGTDNPTVRGDGESPDLYDNDLPEGRFYSRTVNVTVETPIIP